MAVRFRRTQTIIPQFVIVDFRDRFSRIAIAVKGFELRRRQLIRLWQGSM
jgi:hypothetical protein